MLELFGANTGNANRAAIALEEAGLPFKATALNLRSGEQRAPSFLSLNPAAKVPVLVDRTNAAAPFVLTQSNAIMMYAAAQAPAGHLLPPEGLQRLRVLERYFYFVTDVITWSGTAFYLKLQGQTAAYEALETSVIERLEAAEQFLADGAYIAGDSYSLADIAGFTIILAYQKRLDWRPERALVQWFDRVGARPAVQRGLAAFRKD